MEQIPTAEEFLRKNIDYVLSENDCKEDVENAMIEFARLHVESALKEAVKHLPYDDKMNQSLLDERAILNSYPLEKIK
jgi:hypothetical protein